MHFAKTTVAKSVVLGCRGTAGSLKAAAIPVDTEATPTSLVMWREGDPKALEVLWEVSTAVGYMHSD
mgnify:CR=1 FL=1